MADNSDYSKPRTKLQDYLPEVYKSDTAVSVYENLFNRFLTKNETVKVSGYIGEGNPNAVVKRQISEPSIDRQANQLQPILNTKIGSVEHHSSWKDIQNEATRLGIDLSRLPTWGAVQQFNWVPPIDLDKLINYQNYYWYDEQTPNSQPDYIVIHNDCTQKTAFANFWQQLTATYGTVFQIVGIASTVAQPQSYDIVTITTNTIVVDGDITGRIFANQYFDVSNTLSNDGAYQITVSPTFNQATNTSTIQVSVALTPESGVGEVTLRRFDQLLISGDYIQPFSAGFTFTINNSPNTELNGRVLQVESSSYSSSTDQTTLTLTTAFTDNTVGGEISLVEQLTAALAARDCSCLGTIGWDQAQWDDNPNNPPAPVWGNPPDSQPSLIAAISHASAPPLNPVSLNLYDVLWYDTTSDQLYQWNNPDSIASGAWGVVSTNFSTIIAATNGNNTWDQSTSCGSTDIVIPAAQQWINANKWVHKTDVPNFTVAKRAQYPIIEFLSTLELNEWTYTRYNWSYREDNTSTWSTAAAQPQLIELTSLKLYQNPAFTPSAPTNTTVVYLDESHGDLTSYFVPGKTFAATNNPTATNQSIPLPSTVYLERPVEVSRSYFVRLAGEDSFRTVIESTTPFIVDQTFRLIPLHTSSGDLWRGYNVHWRFDGFGDTVPVNHQPENPLLSVMDSTIVSMGGYQYTAGPFAQDNILQNNAGVQIFTLSSTAISGSSRPLNRRALLGFDDIRVYVNGVQQYGTYNELSSDGVHVTGISFLPGYIPSAAGTTVRIEVGEASNRDVGLSSVSVLTNTGVETISLVGYRKAAQIKTSKNQYPLFDLYNPDGTSALKATHIFGYKTDPSQPVNAALGARIVQSTAPTDFEFEQYLIDYDNGNLYAYRDYANLMENYWVDASGLSHTWSQLTWDDHYYVEDSAGNLYYTPVTIGPAQPSVSDLIDGNLSSLWYNTSEKKLKIRVNAANLSSDYNDLPAAYLSFDQTLQTIWKKGENDETSVPVKVDWQGRTLVEYEQEKQAYVQREIEGGVDPLTAEQNWYSSQANKFSPSGTWIGDWNIPDPLYFNNQHENRKQLSYRDLLTHFNSVIDAQPNIPGFNGPKTNMYHLLPPSGVNFGLGGKIKEFNDGFDTFLSSVYVDTVNPLSLIDFAQTQYENALNNLRVTYSENLLGYLTTISQAALLDQSTFISDRVIEAIEENESLSLLYGDSTTYNDVTNTGIRNWIDTLVYFKLLSRAQPLVLSDSKLAVRLISHHDGHTNAYAVPANVIESVSRLLATQPDDRGTTSDTFSRTSTNVPPQTIAAFASSFATSIDNREGVYWYYTPVGGPRTLYRLSVVSAGTQQPVDSLPDGVLWIDTGTNTLRAKNGVSWIAVTSVGDGVISSAWTVVNLQEYLTNVVLSVEQRLFDNAPTFEVPAYNLNSLQSLDPFLYNNLLEQQFLNYVASEGILSPYRNTTYLAADPFTWNYTYSTIGAGYEIIDTDPITQCFVISDPAGLYAGTFIPGETFFVKNSGTTNDGEWTISVSGAVWNSSTKQTSVFVEFTSDRSVLSGSLGVLYRGDLLPSNTSSGAESAGDWRALYNAFYHTPYPHLEPWKLQGYTTKPEWWDIEYKGTTRRWSTQMWTNIFAGRVPAGRQYPNGVTSVSGIPATDRATPILLSVPDLPTYNYCSVNITNAPILGLDGKTYEPDDVFPPYWAGPITPTVRSLFTNISLIVSPGADYVFGKPGPVEWEWRTSTRYLYDQLSIAFKMDPVRFISQTFGTTFLIVNNLQIDKATNNTFSHTRTNFHGDVVNGQEFISNGLNQWYVNFNRYNSLDSSYSNFRVLWTGWTAPMTYQLSSFIDTDSFILGHRTVPVSSFDWEITSKHSPGVNDYWLDALKVTVTSMPPPVIRYNNERQWEFVVNTNLPVSRSLSYYDVQNYQFINLYSLVNGIKTPSNIFSLYTYPVIGVDALNNSFMFDGDQTDVVKQGRTFEIFDSTSLDGTYAVLNSAYDALNKVTIVTVTAGLVQPGVAESFGMARVNYRTLPWQTGELVYLTTDETIPAPLFSDEQYFVIRINDTQFQLALTYADAIANNPITITSIGRQNQYIGKLQSTFVALEGQNTAQVWKHYAIDKSNVLTLSTPHPMSGIQTFINLVDGYSVWLQDQGWQVNATGELRDFSIPTRVVSWQLEIERFINYIFGIRTVRNLPIANTYPVSVNTTTSQFTFVAQQGQFITGDAVILNELNNVFPSPLLRNIRYYVIVDNANTIRLASTRLGAEQGNAITLDNVPYTGQLSIAPAQELVTGIVTFELNPFRNGIWFNTPSGVVSDIFNGPSEDVRTSQLIFDQYGRPLGSNITRVLRQDKQTQILIQNGVPNDVQLTTVFSDPYNYLHLGGLHLFTDTYENIVVFNNYTTQGQLLYDPFLGLNVTKFELQFYRQADFTQRPNVGGFYLSSFYNQTPTLRRNIEAQTEDLRYLYDTYVSIETSPLVAYSRKTLGYEGVTGYLNAMNLDPKSQFVFWRGMIQEKGSVNAINAFTNSRRFQDAVVDEFWAIKLADFGSSAEKFYPELYLTTEDGRSNDVRLDFVVDDDLCYPGYAVNVYDQLPCGYAFPHDGEPVLLSQNGFTPILLSNQDRWYNQPDQLAQLNKYGGTMFFTLKAVGKMPVGFVNDGATISTSGDYVANVAAHLNTTYSTGRNINDGLVYWDTVNNIHTFWKWLGATWSFAGYWDSVPNGNRSVPVLRHGFKADAVRVTLNWYTEGTIATVSGVTGNTVTSANGLLPYLPFTDSIEVFRTTGGVTTPLVSGIDYAEVIDVNGNLLSDSIYFPTALSPADELKIIYKGSTLVEDLHYSIVNADVISILIKELVDGTALSQYPMNFTIWGLIEDENSQNPAKIIDVQSKTVLTNVQIWDPARGINYAQSMQSIDLFRPTNPAIYNNTPTSPTQPVTPNIQFWSESNVGTVWMDTSAREYFRYYDVNAVGDTETRFAGWGDLADWGSAPVYEWVSSDVPPDQWNDLATVQENDISIPEADRKSGRIFQTLFENIGGEWVRVVARSQELDVSVEGTPTPSLGEVTEYTFKVDQQRLSVFAYDITSVNTLTKQFVIPGDLTQRFISGYKFGYFEPGNALAQAVYTVASAVFNVGTNLTTITFAENVSGVPTAGGFLVDLFNIYLNGRLIIEDYISVVSGGNLFVTLPVDVVGYAQHLTFVVLPPTNTTLITAGIAAGRYLQSYEYTEVPYYDSFGVLRYTYYFWVQNKITKGRTWRTLSPADAQDDYVNNPAPFMFFQNIKDPATVTINGFPVDMPLRYSQCVIRGLRGLISDNRRFIIRYTRDYTLRDSLDHGNTPLALKNKHQEWELIRLNQDEKVRKVLWDKITSSIVGFDISNPSVIVPSLTRQLYDATYGTSTSYGFGNDQAFANGPLALDIILAYLQSSQNNFQPIDINLFFQQNSFNTAQSTIAAMNEIYQTFAAIHVNAMFFSVLKNAALTQKLEYPGVFKTSMISVTSVTTLDTGTLLDD